MGWREVRGRRGCVGGGGGGRRMGGGGTEGQGDFK